jgi:hypothetical protein
MQNMGRNFAHWLALAATALLVACGGGGGSSAPTYTIGGNVTVTGAGALAPGLVLQVNGGDSLPRSTTGTFTFATPVPSSTTYTVTVSAQPATQNCLVTNASAYSRCWRHHHQPAGYRPLSATQRHQHTPDFGDGQRYFHLRHAHCRRQPVHGHGLGAARAAWAGVQRDERYWHDGPLGCHVGCD